jgi:hypothetical protein
MFVILDLRRVVLCLFEVGWSSLSWLTGEQQAKTVLDDILYNIVHDIVLKTHREEKMARAATAAIVVESKAAQEYNDETLSDDVNQRVETNAAIYNNGEVYLRGNPLKIVKEIYCPNCGKPRLLHPTNGNRARKPEPGVEYCKKEPYIEKDYHDVYGQTFQPDGPGRGKKKKDMFDPLKLAAANGDSPSDGDGVEKKPIQFPHAKCHNCGTFLPIKRMNNHMAKCMGGGGRDSSRNALWKIQNGNSNGNGSQGGSTPPPGSRNGTPAPSNNSKRASPAKRDRDEDDSDSSPQKKPKKMQKKTATNKFKDLKAPKMSKSASQQREASNLSFEEKPPGNSESEDDDDEDGSYGSVAVDPKKKKAAAVKKSAIKDKKKWIHGKIGAKASLPQNEPPDSSSGQSVTTGVAKIKLNLGSSVLNGRVAADAGGESESSQTLSSPN